MYIVITTFDLKESNVGFAELREWVRDRAARDYSQVTGMSLKAWFSHEHKRLWGAVYLVEDADVFREGNMPRLPDGRSGPVGTRPTSETWLDLECLVLGPGGLEGLGGLLGDGLSWETG